tara:strand:+ start:10850 stop:11608 length:759 start_codon:yes stop_codon:yes gene_type:complete
VIKKYNGWSLPEKEQHFQQWLYENKATDYQYIPYNEVLKLLEKRVVAVDIGANIGMMTTRYSEVFEEVYSFEPVDLNYECLQDNVKHLDNVKTYNVALGDKVQDTFIHNEANYSNSGGWSINDFTNATWMHYNKKIKLVKESIHVQLLDNYKIKPDFIKIDTQNYELQVLKGAENTIKQSLPIIQIEVDKMTVRQVMRHPITKYLRKLAYIPLVIVKKDWIYGPVKLYRSEDGSPLKIKYRGPKSLISIDKN